MVCRHAQIDIHNGGDKHPVGHTILGFIYVSVLLTRAASTEP